MIRSSGCLVIIIFSLVFQEATAQVKEIYGKVYESETGEALVGANVYIKGATGGVLSGEDGWFSLKFNRSLPFTLVISGLGFKKQEIVVDANTDNIIVELSPSILAVNEVVFTASRLEESIMRSPVAIEKLTIRDLRESPAATLFDAMEYVKGVQMTTVSFGFKVPNTRGFNNTTNPRFLSMVDGSDTQAPGLGVSIANSLGPSELDIESIEIVPGATSALYGMNALNGTFNMVTKNPFVYEGISFYQRTGVNHIDGIDFAPQVATEYAFRIAKALNDKFAFKINAGDFRGTDWVVQDYRDLRPAVNLSTGLVGAENPALDPLNSYGNESQNRRMLDLADGRRYEVRRTGYFERDLVNKAYGVRNTKLDAALHYKVNPDAELSYTYRFGSTDAIYQRGNRIRLDDYRVQQHKIAFKSENLIMQGYYLSENTRDSYNLRPLAENMDKSFKSDNIWFNEYSSVFNESFQQGLPSAMAHSMARKTADSGRLLPGTSEFDSKLNELIRINNWDEGAQLILEHQLFHFEWQYNLRDRIEAVDILIGSDYRDYIIHPEGNSFINPYTRGDETLNYGKIGAFVQLSKTLNQDRLKLMASGRVDKAQFFPIRFNPRFAAVYSIDDHQHIRASIQNGFRFPTIFEGFSAVNNGGIIRYGGTELMTGNQRLFENSYLRSSVERFQDAIVTDINQGLSKENAILQNGHLLMENNYTYLIPEEIKALDIGYRASLFYNKLFFDFDFYYNMYDNFIDQIEIAVPNRGEIRSASGEPNPDIWSQMEDLNSHTKYRMWTNSKSRYHNFGYSTQFSLNLAKKMVLSGNYTYATLHKIDRRDLEGLETAFNTPEHTVNFSLTDRELSKKLGYSVAWRWQSTFIWNSPLATGQVPSFNTLDLQLSYKLPKLNAIVKAGATNVLNERYTQYVGGPEIGGFYYFSITAEGIWDKLHLGSRQSNQLMK
ncbi:MAG: TonB-dependent receptor [Lunatimonas sp.]|uniref:TonB-dependent receptor n=1 Tax=Lunatimonas sp. TaxID=2060141 RepID=UPI00263B14C4|nr:TonB-dependent receptor [Lunatimonas sp.]MCC5939183.1 TonB-dependent receptor [Lunatimonas sp.]